ncbi:hypothetical protein [Azospirillum soli]|uniref:hypothetical protein n=1 Tax=Azospirillum soli TaxID=1304799 RepID=UPI001AE80DD4|nr:hypothetical protein [Azospirillum soli]MBP2315237.1 hypothetical protein [Azospirillum soli]
MIGSDLTSMKDMLANAFTRAAAAKDKAARDTQPKAEKKDASDPAFLLSANLQDLTGRLRDLTEGASDAAKNGVAQADDALGRMQGILDYTDEFAEQLDGVMQAMGRDLGRMLKAFGMGDEETDEAVKGFTDRFGKDERQKAAHEAPPAAELSQHRESSAVSVEATNIELTLEQGGKTLTLTFDRTSLSMAHTSETVQAATDGRSSVFGMERSAATLNARSESFTLQADGFSVEELDGIMKSLQGAMTKPSEGLEGQATLKPLNAPKDGEALHLSLDLKGLLTSAFGEKGAKAAGSMGKEIEKQGFDVRV